MEDIKNQLKQKYPFMKKVGKISSAFDKNEMLHNYRNEKLLILMVGTQGSGKTTFCQKNFAEYEVRNLDDILAEYLQKNRGPLTIEGQIAINKTFLERLGRDLEEKGIAIADAGAINFPFREMVLEYMQGKYTKVVLIVLNPPINQIKRQIKKQMELRARPGLWEDLSEEYGFLQIQISEGFLEMGVDEVFMV